MKLKNEKHKGNMIKEHIMNLAYLSIIKYFIYFHIIAS